MPTRTIATRIAVEGEKEFAKALKSAGREIRVLGSELNVAKAEFETNGDKQAFLTEKSRVLTAQMEQQKEIIRALEANIREMSKSWGEGSEEADQFAIQLNNARLKAARMQKELNETKDALNDVDDGMEDATRESRTFARSMERNVEEKAEDSEKALQGLGDELLDMRQAMDDLRNMEGVQLGMDIAGGVWDAGQALFDYANNAREYNRQLAFLEVNAANAKIDYSTAEAEAFEAASYIGDLDSALEGVNELLAAGMDTTSFIQSMDLLTGAAMRFPDTLKFESLADGMQETLATGKGAGQFAELLERMGVDIDAFNAGLANAKANGDEVGYTLTFLSQHGLADTKRQFGETNRSMVEAERAMLDWEREVKSFGETLDPVIAGVYKLGAGFLGWINSDIERNEKRNETFQANEAERYAKWQSGEISYWEYLGSAFGEGLGYAGEAWGIAPAKDVDTAAFDDISTELQEMETEAGTSGAALVDNMTAAIDEAAPLAVAAAQSMADQISAALGSIAVPSLAGMMPAAYNAYNAGISPQQNWNLVLNGRRIGQLMTPAISTMQGRQSRIK